MTNHDELCEKDGKKDFDVDAFIEYHVGDCSCEHGHECQPCTMKRELKKEIKELRTRVADWRADAVKHAQEVLGLRAKLSTLLKASEGMAECLVNVQIDLEDMIKDRHTEGVLADVIKTLADFRAVKETMKKGEGK